MKKIKIDTGLGGNGDIWMRLVSFYVAAKLFPTYQIELYIPPFFKNIAEHTFGDRLSFLNDATDCRLVFTSLGLRDMIGGFTKGKRFIAPYHRVVVEEKTKKTLKDNINIQLFNLLHSIGLVQLPKREYIPYYQGFLDIAGIRDFRELSYTDFLVQLEVDANNIFDKLNRNTLPSSKELHLPKDIAEQVVIFPNGTSRQFIPVWWAKQQLPDAYYAFFVKDSYAKEFEQVGLKTISFYKEPGDIIKLAQAASWTISTDSFPSHLLQYAVSDCTIAITEVLKSRIISPVHRGKVVDAVAKCHPCPHLERKTHPLCSAGHAACINWNSEIYSSQLVESVKAQETPNKYSL